MGAYYRWKELNKDGEVLLMSNRFPSLRALLQDLVNETYAHEAMQTPLKLSNIVIDTNESGEGTTIFKEVTDVGKDKQ